MTTVETSNSITGRDGYVQAQALIYAIACIQSLPEDRQEWSNMRDMCAIARTLPPVSLNNLVYGVQCHTGTVIDLWPDHDDDLSVKERREKKAFKFALASYIEERTKQFDAFMAANPLRGEAA